MRLIALYNEPYATPDALQFPQYPQKLSKEKLQQKEKDDVSLPVSDNLFHEM